MIFVADASAIGAALLPDEAGPMADLAVRLSRERTIVAPAHWPLELASLVLAAHRRKRLTDKERDLALDAADALVAEARIASSPRPSRVADEAGPRGLSAYDAAYLMLCVDLGAPLLTGDGALRRAALAGGVELLAP